jgi:hypothetical protein
MYTGDYSGKHINPDNFWFFIVSLYFREVSVSDLNQLEELRMRMPSRPILRIGDPHSSIYTVKTTYDFQDDVFVVENRVLIAQQQQHENLVSIMSTPL